MNGQRARAERKAMPPDLKREMKDRIRVLAQTRSEAIGKARTAMRLKIAAAQAEGERVAREEWQKFEANRAAIRAEYEARAASR